MRVIHLLRKPLSEGTVAANTLTHGVGGLNIDGCRTSTGDILNGGRYAEHGVGEADGSTYGHGINKRRPGEYQQPSGRWPGNLILQHLDGCRCEGVKRVAGRIGWICVEGCPVRALDAQSGVVKGTVRQPTGKPVYPTDGAAVNWNPNSVRDTTVRGFGDTGGASRYFKQVGGSKK